MKKRPPLTEDLTISDFQDFYWERKELSAFCKTIDLSSQGGKEDIAARILHFLKTGKRLSPPSTKHTGPLDSEKGLTLDTPVINYKNDVATRAFLEPHLDTPLRVNQYLRDFCKQTNDGSLTYRDLIDGYKKSLLSKKETIDKQFQYNQFQRDFFKHETNKTREDCAAAWKLVRSAPGQATYEHYKSITH